ncbi:MAG: acetolactate synthase [Odoribacter sp.]|nr:acetolactate synthase [Odoribacter sp.]
MTVAEYIASQLVNAGVKYVFGIPGGPSIPYMEAFRAAGIEFILTSNESAAATMADVTARLTGIPGVCHATFGAGATNITTGTGEALLDRSPVIVFTSEMPDSMLHRTTQMNIDHQKLFEAVTKKSFRLNHVNVKEVMNSALRICTEEYPGPVHIGLPSDIAGMEIDESEFKTVLPGMTEYNNEINVIITLLEKSRRPLIAIGLTAARLGLKKALLDFLNDNKIPVVVTPMAKGLIPEDHPCYTGVLFHALSDYLEDIYDRTDLVIGIGYDPVEYNYESWIPDVPLIHFNTVETDMPSGMEVLQFIGEPVDWFPVLRRINTGALIFEKTVIEGIRNEMVSVFNGFLGRFGPVSVLKILKDELPPDSIITADVGSHLHLIGQYWNTPSPEKLIMTNGWSSMGFGLPSAISAQLNSPGSTVVCLTGDGGFLMMAGELVTASRYKLPVITVVFSDGELNLIKIKQSWKELQPYGTQIYSGDLFGTDTFLGLRVLTADSEEDMIKAVNIALSLDEPVIINAIIDPEDYKWLIVKQK